MHQFLVVSVVIYIGLAVALLLGVALLHLTWPSWAKPQDESKMKKESPSLDPADSGHTDL